MKKIILHLCADIGSDSRFYDLDDNYEVIKIGSDIGVENYNPPKNVYGIIANPVCTEFSTVNGFDKTGNLEKGMFLVNHCLRIIEQAKPIFWVLENPAKGRLKDKLGKPRFTYQLGIMAALGVNIQPCGESLIFLKKFILNGKMCRISWIYGKEKIGISLVWHIFINQQKMLSQNLNGRGI